MAEAVKINRSPEEVNILGLMSTAKVLVVGPIVVNETITGKCKRIASDFPIPVFEQTDRAFEIGGPGNVVKNLNAMGLAVDLLTMIGEHDNYVRDTMHAKHIDTSGTVVCPGYSVAKKIRYISDNHVMFRVNEGNEDFTIDDHMETKLVTTFRAMTDHVEYSVIVLSDYRFGMLSEFVTSSIISIAVSKGIPVVADPPKFGSYDKFKSCTYFKPNLDEAKHFLGRGIDSEDEIRAACIELCRRMESSYSIITLAERGIAFFDQVEDRFGVMPVSEEGINVVDVSGAGDTALAAITFGIVFDIGLENSCRLANQCAVNIIQKPGGSVTVDMLDIINQNETVVTSKIEVENLKKLLVGRGNLVLVMDSFDHLTERHLNILKEARTLAEHVLVAVELTDDSSKAITGLRVPVTELLGSNKNVDFVIVFDTFDRQWLIETLQPEYLAEMTAEGGTCIIKSHLPGF